MFRRIKRVPRQNISTKIKEVKKATKDILKNNRVTEKEYEDRLKTCNDCVYLTRSTNMCKVCGCFMKVKASLPSSSCPLGKWSLRDSSVNSTQHDDGCENSD